MKRIKKIISLLVLLVCSAVCFAQTFPNNINQSNAATKTTFPGSVNTALQNRYFADTTAANAVPYLKFTPHIQIKVGESIYVRNTAATAWLLQANLPDVDSIININNYYNGQSCESRKLSGDVFRIGASGMTFQNTLVIFQLNCRTYTVLPSIFTFPNATPSTENYIKVYADTLGNVGYIVGGTSPLEIPPLTDQGSQIELVTYLIRDGVATPVGISSTSIYFEGIEWTFTSGGIAGTNEFYTGTPPFAGTYSLYIPTSTGVWTKGFFFDGDTIGVSKLTIFNFQIYLHDTLDANARISISFRNNNSYVTSNVVLKDGIYGLDGKKINEWQPIALPKNLWTFQNGTSVINGLTMTFNGTIPTAQFDNIQWQNGGSNTGGIQLSPPAVDTGYLKPSDSSTYVYINKATNTILFELPTGWKNIIYDTCHTVDTVGNFIYVDENPFCGGMVKSIVPGSNITVDNTDPLNPIISATGGGGGSGISEFIAGYGLTNINDSSARVDSSVIATRDRLINELALKLNISDTAAMLAWYQTAINSKLVAADTVYLHNKLLEKLQISDTTAMLSPYKTSYPRQAISLTFTTTGTSGAATGTYNNGTGVFTINVPQYSGGGGGRHVDTMYRNTTKDSTIFFISGIRYAIKGPNDSAYVNTIFLNDSTLIFVRNNTNRDTIRLSSPTVFTSSLNGLVPASGGGTTNFLRADGTFAAPPGSGNWSLTGNSGTTPGTNFLGTTDTKSVVFKMQNVFSGIIDSTSGGTDGRTAFGYNSMNATASGVSATAYGFKSLRALTSGSGNTGLGTQALVVLTTGTGNTAVGHYAGKAVTGSYSTLIGWQAGQGITGNQTVAIGANAMGSYTGAGTSCVAVGTSALINGSGTQNVAIGLSAMGVGTVSGNNNTAIGAEAGASNSSGTSNLYLGFRAGYYNTTASNEIYLNTLGTRTTNYLGHQTESPIYIQQNPVVLSQLNTINGKVGINTISPNSMFQLPRGTTVAGTAPLSFSPDVSLTTTAASGTGAVATLTYATTTTPAFVLGSTIVVAGVTPSGYNGTYVVTAVTATTVSYANATTGSQTVAGTITQGALLTTPSARKMEVDATGLYYTNDAAVRGRVALTFTGTAAPATTPSAIGDIFVDSTNKKMYVATGTASSADWTILN